MANQKYSEKLKDPRWQKKRLEIFERDNWACKYCGNKNETLHVHHLFYSGKSEPWEIHNGFLVTLCESCHDSENKANENGTTFRKDIGVLLNSLWENDWSLMDILDIAYRFAYLGKVSGKLGGIKDFAIILNPSKKKYGRKLKGK